MRQHRCHACGWEISGEYISFRELGKGEYHPHCIVCSGCGRLIEDAVTFENDRMYHAECLAELRGLRCAACGELILDEVLQVMGKVWHPEHFVCASCSKPLPVTPKGVLVRDEKPYCEPCYQSLFMEKCSICKHYIQGEYYKNPWGDLYCGSHEKEFRQCSCCKRPISPALTGGGVQYPDGRAICNLCRRTSVEDPKAAWPAFNKVRRHLARLGLDLVNAPIPLELADQKRILALASGASQGDTYGITSKIIVTQLGVPVEGRVDGISILRGLPWELFTAVSAHELGHAWLCLNQVQVRLPEIEEGFCELLGYLWLESLGTDSSRVWMQFMQENQNLTYSGGLKMALRSYQVHSLAGILAQLRSTALLP